MPSLLLMLHSLSWSLDLFTPPKKTRFGIIFASIHKIKYSLPEDVLALNHSNSAQVFGQLLPPACL